VEQGLEVEGGVEGVGEAEEEFALQRLDPDLGGELRLVRAGPVVAFERVRGDGFGDGRLFGHSILSRFAAGFRRGSSRFAIISRR
jgi:hypothetical protein